MAIRAAGVTAGHLIGEYDASGRAVAEYAWLGDLPLAMRTYSYAPDNSRTATLYAIEPDHLGTPRVLTDMAGQLRWRWHSAPFGDTPPNGNPAGLGAITFNLRFPGQYYDAESGLHYNYFRDYDPGTGRYVQSDPIGLWGGVNTYGYVAGNPLGYVDPLGLWAWGDPIHQGVVDAVTGFGDGVILTLTFGGLSGQGLRDGLDIGGGVNVCSRFYRGGRVAGTTATLLANATGAIPKH